MTDIQVHPRPSPVDRQPEITFQMSRLITRLTSIEAQARAARTDRLPAAGWAPFAMETGLTPAQEAFISGWSPDDVLSHCRAQRQMIHLLRTWLNTQPDGADLTLTLLSTLGDALPDRPGTP